MRSACRPRIRDRPCSRRVRSDLRRASRPETSFQISRSSNFRQSFPRDIANHVREPIELPQRRVNIWRDADTREFFVHDRRREDLVLSHQIAAQCDRINTFDLEIRYRTRLSRIERSIEPDLRNTFQIVHPVSRQVAKPFFLSLAADRVMKEDRLAYSKPHGGGMCADLFVLTNV